MNMKNMIIGMGIGMAGGMAVASYMLTNPKTKHEANKMIDDAVTSARDVYKRQGKDQEVIRQKIVEYQELYALWQKIAVARENNDLQISSYYDDLLYRLYLKAVSYTHLFLLFFILCQKIAN